MTALAVLLGLGVMPILIAKDMLVTKRLLAAFGLPAFASVIRGVIGAAAVLVLWGISGLAVGDRSALGVLSGLLSLIAVGLTVARRRWTSVLPDARSRSAAARLLAGWEELTDCGLMLNLDVWPVPEWQDAPLGPTVQFGGEPGVAFSTALGRLEHRLRLAMTVEVLSPGRLRLTILLRSPLEQPRTWADFQAGED